MVTLAWNWVGLHWEPAFFTNWRLKVKKEKKILLELQVPSLLVVCSVLSLVAPGRLALHCWLLLENNWRSQAWQPAAEASNNSDMRVIPSCCESHQDMVTRKTRYRQKPQTSSLWVCKSKSLPLQRTYILGGIRKNTVLQHAEDTLKLSYYLLLQIQIWAASCLPWRRRSSLLWYVNARLGSKEPV